MSQILNDEPSKAQIVLGSAMAGVLVLASAAVAAAIFIPAFILNIPKAFDHHADQRPNPCPPQPK